MLENMQRKIETIGKVLGKSEQKGIAGGWYYRDCPNVFVPCDSQGRDCRPPFYVNAFGRCTL